MPTELGLPASVDAERTILGAVMLDNAALTTAAVLVAPEDFSLDSHRRIFSRMMDLLSNGVEVDIISLPEELGKHRELESIGGYSYISSLTEGLPHRMNVENYAKMVRDKAQLRKIIDSCNNTIAVCMEQQLSAQHCAAGLQDDIIAIQSKVTPNSLKTAKDIIPTVLREMEQQAQHSGLIGLTTGIPIVDEKTTGIRKGELWVVGALPGRGKTQFGLSTLSANVAKGIPSLIFSLEMTDSQLGRRLLAMHSGVDAGKIQDPKWISKADWPSVYSTGADIMEWPLYVDDASTLSARDLASRARLYIRRHKVELIVADYLMLIDEPREKERRNNAARIANTLRVIAKEEGVGVVALSQISRPSNRDINARPTMLDLKESGDIEAAAHVVPLLYMPMDDNRFTGEDEIIVGKNRNGWIGTVDVTYDRKSLRFLDREVSR